MENRVPIRALHRGLAVLKAINRGPSLSMMEIARSSEVPYPTACRIVQTLLNEGVIEREPNRKRYRPTALVQTLAHGFQGDTELIAKARPHLVELTRSVGWPITLSTHVGHSMVIRDSTHALTALTFNHYHPGYAIPVLDCASGLAYLAHIDEESRQLLLNSLKLLPKRVNLHVIELLENGELVQEILDEGFATRVYNRFTYNPGKTSSIAVPIVKSDGDVAGAISLAFFCSATRMSDAVAKFVAPLKSAAAAISKDINAAEPDSSNATQFARKATARHMPVSQEHYFDAL